MIIGIAGYATAGKDEFARVLCENGFYQKAFADKLRQFAAAVNPIVRAETEYVGRGLCGVSEYVRYNDVVSAWGYNLAKAKYPEVREILQRIGTDAGRQVLGDDIWVEAAMRELEPGENYVFTDVRFPNEFWAVRRAGGALVRINRPGVGPVNDHPSETAVDDLDYDYTIENDGSISDLEGQAISVLDQEVMADWKVFASRQSEAHLALQSE